MPTVTVVVPNLDGASLLPSCLGAIAEQDTDHRVEVVVVDNGSADESIAVVEQILPQARVVRNEENLGFAKPCNQGAALATSEFLLFLNNDVVMSRDCIHALLETAAGDTAAAAWQPLVVKADGAPEPLFSAFTRTGFVLHMPWGGAPPPANVFSLKGACMLVRRSAFEAVGAFDESFFAYFEETDLCWRLHLAGWDVRATAGGCARHAGGATSTRVFSLAHLDYLSFRNRITSMLKNAGPSTLLLVLPVHLLLVLGVVAVFLVRGRWDQAKGVSMAVVDNLRRLPATRRARRDVQALRRRRDRDFLPRLTERMTFARAKQLLFGYTITRPREVDAMHAPRGVDG
jgi:N-acetylglucosaminyl-diphospho-decaprenol L-rhamnosyltransferase